MVGLTGCGDNTSGSGGAMSAPPANTKATVTVGNIGDQTYARAILLDQNGNALASQEINCKAKENNCKIYVPAELNQPVTLIVQDGQGHLLGAFQAKAGQANAETLYPSAATTGIYLTEQLERKYLSKEGISIEQANARLRTFFQAYQGPGAIDFNVLIAAYMAKQHATNPGLSDAQVLEALAKRLKDGEVAKPEEFSPPKKQSAFTTGDKLAGAFDRLLTGKTQLISAAHAQETCSGGLSTFLTVTSNLGDVFPIAGDVVSGLAGIGQEACDDTSAKLDKLSSQIQALAQSVDKVGENLMKAKGLAEDGWINSQTQKFKDGRNLVVKHKKAYNDFLNQNLLANNVKASSLEEWFKANGGWEAGLKKDGAEASLMPILKSMNVIIEQTTGITEDNSIKTYFQALNDKCKDSNGNAFTPGLNFIAVRQQCNNAIFASAAYVVSYREALPMAKDIFSVLAKYQKEVGASVFNKVGFPKPATDLANKYSIDFDSYDTAYAQTKKTFDSQQTEFLADAKANVGHGGKGYFEAFEGLPPELLTNLAKVQCNQIKSPDTPSIVGWFAPSADKNQNYIVTLCRIGTSTASPNIKSKYYYAGVESRGGNTPVNMMGVPMASAYLNKNSGYGEETTKENIDNVTPFYMVIPISTPNGSEPNTFNISVNPPFRQESITNVYKPYIPLGPECKGYTNYSAKAKYITLKPQRILLQFSKPSVESETEDFVRYTDKDGFSYIWKHRITNAYASRNHYMRCVSADCSVTDNNHRLSFKDGPQSIWFLQKHNPFKGYYYNYTIDGKNIE
jgi:hypothetical protein